MASIRTRTTRSGDTRYAVLWRENGKQSSLTFTDVKKAERFCLDLDIDGSEAALARLQAGGGPTGEAGEWTVETWMERHITHHDMCGVMSTLQWADWHITNGHLCSRHAPALEQHTERARQMLAAPETGCTGAAEGTAPVRHGGGGCRG